MRFKDEIIFRFGNANAIYGYNDTGKTTIPTAIAIAYYNFDLTGSNRGLDSKINTDLIKEYNSPPPGTEAAYQTWVQQRTAAALEYSPEMFRQENNIKLIVPQFEITITHENPDGTMSTVYRSLDINGKSKLKLNGKNISQKGLVDELGLTDAATFLSGLIPGYFQRLKQEDQRKILLSLMKENLDKNEIINSVADAMIIPATQELLQVNGGSWEASIKQSKQVADDLRTNAIVAEAARQEVEHLISELKASTPPALTEIDSASALTSRLTIVEAQIKLAEQAEGVARTNTEIEKNNQEIDLENATAEEWNRNIEEKKSAMFDEMAKADAERTKVEKQIDEVRDELGALEKGYRDIQALIDSEVQLPPQPQLNLSDMNLQPIPNLDLLGIKNCPICDGDIETHVAKQIEEITVANKKIEDEAQAKLAEDTRVWAEKCSAIRDDIAVRTEDMKKQNKTIHDKIERRRKKISDLEQKKSQILVAFGNIQNSTGSIQRMPVRNHIPSKQPPAGSGNLDVVSLKAERETLKMKLNQHDGVYQTTAEQMSTADRRLASLKDIESEAKSQAGFATLVWKALKAGAIEEGNRIIRSLEPVLDNVTIVLTENGRDVFKPYFKGLPLRECSRSAEMKCGIELAIMISNLCPTPIPIYVDDAESILDLPSKLTTVQYFVAYVSRDHKSIAISVG